VQYIWIARKEWPRARNAWNLWTLKKGKGREEIGKASGLGLKKHGGEESGNGQTKTWGMRSNGQRDDVSHRIRERVRLREGVAPKREYTSLQFPTPGADGKNETSGRLLTST